MPIICKGKGKSKGARKVTSKECPFQTLMPEFQILIPVDGSQKGDSKYNSALWTEVYKNCRNSNIKLDKQS